MAKKKAAKKAAKKKGGRKMQPEKNRDKQIQKTQEQVEKIQAEIDAGDASPEKAQDLQNQKAKLERLQGGEDVPDESEA